MLIFFSFAVSDAASVLPSKDNNMKKHAIKKKVLTDIPLSYNL